VSLSGEVAQAGAALQAQSGDTVEWELRETMLINRIKSCQVPCARFI